MTATATRSAKVNRVSSTKQKLRTCITIFGALLCHHCTTTTWKWRISRFVEDVNTRKLLSFSFLDLQYSFFGIQLQKNLPAFEWTKWNNQVTLSDGFRSLSSLLYLCLTELTVAHSLTAARTSNSSIISLSLWSSCAKASSDNSWKPFVLKTLSVFSSMNSKQRSLNSSCP